MRLVNTIYSVETAKAIIVAAMVLIEYSMHKFDIVKRKLKKKKQNYKIMNKCLYMSMTAGIVHPIHYLYDRNRRA